MTVSHIPLIKFCKMYHLRNGYLLFFTDISKYLVQMFLFNKILGAIITQIIINSWTIFQVVVSP